MRFVVVPAPPSPIIPVPSTDQPCLDGFADQPVDESSVASDRHPGAEQLISRFVRAMIETWQGRRPPQQVAATMPAPLAALMRADGREWGRSLTLRRAVGEVINDRTIEGVALLDVRELSLGVEVLACTVRLERGVSSWLCTHYRLLRPSHVSHHPDQRASPASHDPDPRHRLLRAVS